jgi:hypothetical protein
MSTVRDHLEELGNDWGLQRPLITVLLSLRVEDIPNPRSILIGV